MRNIILAVVLCTAIVIGLPNATDLAAQAARQAGGSPDSGDTADAVSGPTLAPVLSQEPLAQQAARARLQSDLVAMQRFSPSYRFWYHVFTKPAHELGRKPAATVVWREARHGARLPTSDPS